MEKIGKVLEKISYILSWVSIIVFIFIMLIQIVNVVSDIWNTSVPGIEEIIERSLLCGVFASFAYTQAHKRHVSITLLTQKYPKKLWYFMECVWYIVCAAIVFITAYAAWTALTGALEDNYTTGILHIPTWPFYIAEIIGLILLGIIFIYDAVNDAIAGATGKPIPDFEDEADLQAKEG